MAAPSVVAATLLLVVAHGARAQEGARWSRASASGTSETVQLHVREPTGAVVHARGTELWRERNGATERIGCTDPLGTGAIHAMCLGPTDMTFVGAERGLFLLHDSVGAVDRVPLAEGAPAGPVVGVLSDREDRLWLATRERFACVHVGQWFGRTHAAGTGLPPPPYDALASGLRGEPCLLAADGWWHYRPVAAPPAIASAAAGPADAAGLVGLVLRAEAGAGELVWRWRAASHHVLRPVTGGSLRLGHPGRHDLLVYAFDDELERSAPAALSVVVPYPPMFDRRVLVPVVLGSSALVLALALAIARVRGRPLARAALGAGLFVAVVLQLVGAWLGHGRSYPFIGFAMYREVYRPDDVLYGPELVARAAGGRWQEVPAGLLGFATDGEWRHLATLLYTGAAERAAWLAARPPGADGPWTAFELRVRRCRLTAEGPTTVAPWVLARFATDGGGR